MTSLKARFTAPVCALATLFSTLSLGAAAPIKSLVFGNDAVCRHLELGQPGLRTVAFTNRLTGHTLPVQSDEFRLYLPDNQVVNGREFELVKIDQSDSRLRIVLAHPNRPIEAAVTFTAKTAEPFIRKTVALRSTNRTFCLRDIDVECIKTDADTDLGGRGQPLYIGDDFFFALEYPAAFNILDGDAIVLRHFPGKHIGTEEWTSKTAILGVGTKGKVRTAFMNYVDTIRIPPRSYLLYNSWYDLRGKDLCVEKLAETYEDFRKHLAPYGVTMASFVPDDGWQNKQSIWQPNREIIPNGYRPLADILAKGGTGLGLWMPLTGVNLDVPWGEKEGYETGSSRHYCMSGPKYNAKIREVLRHHILEWHVSYFKHDFNSFSCAKAGHGHLPETRYGFEANVDAEIELLKYSRSLNPDIFLNVTSNMWLSPWWLQYADAIWMGCSDHGYIKSVPAIEPRDWAITYRDHHLWRRFRGERAQFPMSAVMTHGVIYGQLRQLGGKNEPLDKWSDNVVWYFLRGMQMKELYVTPSILTDAQWDVLGRACRWATDNAPILRNAELILGDAGKGEVYGFAARADGVAYFGFRNPGLAPQDAAIEARDLIGNTPSRLKLIYPYKCDAGTLTPDGAVHQALGPTEIRIYRADAADVKTTQLNPEAFGETPHVVGVQTRTPETGPDEYAFQLDITPRRQDLTKLTLALILDHADDIDARKGFSLTVDTQPLRPAEIKLQDMCILHAELPTTAHTLEVRTTAQALSGPFRRNLHLSGWLIVDRKGTPGPQPATLTELACPYATRRRVGVPLGISGQIDLARLRQAALTEEAMHQIKAAMLHVYLFGSNDREYADKPLLINGNEVGKVPTNGRPLDAWQRKLVSIPKDKLSTIGLSNQIQFGNCNGDCYKLRDVALAVQLADGTWVETPMDHTVYCSVTNWLHSEGTTFNKDITLPISANFRN